MNIKYGRRERKKTETKMDRERDIYENAIGGGRESGRAKKKKRKYRQGGRERRIEWRRVGKI